MKASLLLEQYIHDQSSPEDPVLEELSRQTHVRFLNPNMISGHLQGKLLEMIARMIKPVDILEIGTFTGYSAICLAKGLKENGKLITIEINDELLEFSHDYFEKAGVSDKIIQLTGKAQDIIPGLNQNFDLVYIDGDKREYCEYFTLVKQKVRPEGFIIVDNVLWGGKVLERETRDQQTRGIIKFNDMISKEPGIENIILPVRDGIMLVRLTESA
jgi:caffeoyl-CoA O-methyltransferase